MAFGGIVVASRSNGIGVSKEGRVGSTLFVEALLENGRETYLLDFP